MNMKAENGRRTAAELTLLFALTYMVSYITRINYGAIIAEMERATGFTRSQLSMALTGSFITYGTGQVISGICGDRIAPKRLISWGLAATVGMNLLIPLCGNPYQMLAVWCLNGFAQSFMWPPMVRLMTCHMEDEEYKRASTRVSWGSSFGTIIVYLMGPFLIAFRGWRSVFYFSALCGALMILVWNRFCPDDGKPVKTGGSSEAAGEGHTETHAKAGETGKTENGRKTCVYGMVFAGIMAAIVLQGMLRDGVTTWMPSYIAQTYHLNSVISILTGVILPVFGILCMQAALKLYQNVFVNPVKCAGVLFAAGTVCALFLLFGTGRNAAVSVLFSAMLTGCMHGVNLILICMIPPFFGKQGHVATVSGVLNSCTYIGSALSAYGTALLSEYAGWTVTLLLWLAAAAVGTILCLLCRLPWERTWGRS